MQSPAIPKNEKTRLETLRALKILDSDPEERFDRLTRLAKRLFGSSIALISLVDADRQWFKSSFGLEVKETTRELSFCGHAILGDEIFEVSDALLDSRFSDNPLVTESPNIRFYAGCPLTVANGSKLGTLCILDQEPRNFDEEDKILLRDLARMVEVELSALQLATTDELTLLSNRRGFESLAQHALSVCIRLDLPASMLFFDLNKFKQINDQFGHAEGDRALTTFSSILLEVFRDSDVIGRLGGDEFVVLLTNSDEAESQIVLERLATAVASENQKAKRGYDISYSNGVTQYDPKIYASISALLDDSDKRMYLNKKNESTR
jgi:diguanylate cyclase (GGDEF)-like protein